MNSADPHVDLAGASIYSYVVKGGSQVSVHVATCDTWTDTWTDTYPPGTPGHLGIS